MRSWCEYRYVRRRWRILFALIDAVGWTFRNLGASLATRSEPPQAVSSILVVQLDHLGDAILSHVLLQGLKAAYPHARLDVLASQSNAEYFATRDEIDRVHTCHVNRFARGRRFGWILSMIRWGIRLRREKYDLAIDPRGDFPIAVILWLTGAPIRLGWDCGGGGFLLTHRADYVRNRHEVLSRRAVLRAIGVEVARSPTPVAYAPGSPGRPQIVLHLGAGTSAKRWPLEHWQELIGRLILEYDPQITLIGTADDPGLDHTWPGVTDLRSKLSIIELEDLLRQADLFIGGDSGPAHLAASVGTPVVAIFSGTNRPEQWRPWGDHVSVVRHETACSPCHQERCPLADHPCLSNLRPTQVMAAIDHLLKKGLPHDRADSRARRSRGTSAPSAQ